MYCMVNFITFEDGKCIVLYCRVKLYYNVLQGKTPLHRAVCDSSYKVVSLLVSRGANVQARDSIVLYFYF